MVFIASLCVSENIVVNAYFLAKPTLRDISASLM
jgi:hypothetical protein